MFVHRVCTYPTPGKEDEFRTLLEERVRTAPERQVQNNLMEQMFVPEGPVFVITVLHPDLDAFVRFRDQNQSEPASQAFVAKMNTLSRKPWTMEFYEELVNPERSGPTPHYAHRQFFYPAVAKESEMRATLEDLVRKRQSEGRLRLRLMQQLFAPSGPVFVIADNYHSLSEHEQVRQERSPNLRAALARLSTITRSPNRDELYEILIM